MNNDKISATAPEKPSVKEPVLRRNTFSFEDSWISKFQHTSHAPEVMDFVDDSDVWSLASYDSACSTEVEPTFHHRSLPGFPRRSSFKDLTKLKDSGLSKDSPQSAPGKRLTAAPDNLPKDLGSDLSEQRSRSGLSNSMIMNWLSFKKYQQYPTIIESPDDSRGSPVEESTMDSVMQVIQNPPASLATSEPPVVVPAVKPSGKLVDAAMPFSPDAAATTSPQKAKFSFKDLNAMAPSCW